MSVAPSAGFGFVNPLWWIVCAPAWKNVRVTVVRRSSLFPCPNPSLCLPGRSECGSTDFCLASPRPCS